MAKQFYFIKSIC